VGRRFVWCWDARPYPFFPSLTKVWLDGENYRLGHWIAGKIGNMRLSAIVRDLCLRAGLADSEFDASALDDEVVGYVVVERKPVRDMIAVLQAAYFFDAVERDGKLVFVKRGSGAPVSIDPNDLGASENDSDRSRVKVERAQDTELPIAVDVVHIDEGRDYQSSTVTVRKQVGRSESVNTLSFPIVLTVEQAQAIGQRALREMWQGRETIDLRLPTRAVRLDPTDTVEVPIDGVWHRLRLTSVTYGKPGLVLVRGVATDGGIPEFYVAPTGSGALPPSAAEPVAPIRVELLDMPIMIDQHDASAASFYVAVCPVGAGRFRGATLFMPTADGLDYVVAAVASLPSVMGATVTDLAPGPAWRWDRVNTVEVQLDYGSLQSLADERVLAGANAALIGDEIVQFASAELIGEGRYRFSRLLRGQRGTEQVIVTHPAGSRFVLLDPARQPRPNFSVSRVGAAIAWRTAPVPQGPTGDLSGEIVFTDAGKGLRPFAPVQLKAARDSASGDVALSWIRRTRVGGDAWLNEVPLGEETEDYEAAILNGGNIVRTLRVATPSALYPSGQQSADFGAPPATLAWRVVQISRAYGRGVPAETASTL
jgi:Putative phage tail protein